MAIELLKSSAIRARLTRILRPTTKWGRFTLWLGVLCLLLWTADIFGAKVEGWADICHHYLRLRSLCNVLPLGIPAPDVAAAQPADRHLPLYRGHADPAVVAHGWHSQLAFRRPISTYVVISDLHSELQHLQAANDALAAQLFPLEKSGKLDERIAGEFTRASDERFPGRTVTLWRKGEAFVLSTGGVLLTHARRANSGFHQRRLYRICCRSRWPASARDQTLRRWRPGNCFGFRYPHYYKPSHPDRGASGQRDPGSARPKRYDSLSPCAGCPNTRQGWSSAPGFPLV